MLFAEIGQPRRLCTSVAVHYRFPAKVQQIASHKQYNLLASPQPPPSPFLCHKSHQHPLLVLPVTPAASAQHSWLYGAAAQVRVGAYSAPAAPPRGRGISTHVNPKGHTPGSTSNAAGAAVGRGGGTRAHPAHFAAQAACGASSPTRAPPLHHCKAQAARHAAFLGRCGRAGAPASGREPR